MKQRLLALASVGLSLSVSSAAISQTVPDYGNYQARNDNFRVGVQLGTGLSASFGQNVIDDIIDYLDPSEISAYAAANGGTYNPFTRVSSVLDLRGATVLAGYAQNSQNLTLTFLDRSGGVLNVNGQACSFTYNAINRQQAFNQFDAETDEVTTPRGRQIYACLAQAWSRNSPVDPLVGNPFSLQGVMTRQALDFAEGDSLVEQPDGANSAGDPWVIGATYSAGSAGRFNLGRIDARVAKGWRIFEGNRARLKLDLPFSYTTIKGSAAYAGQIGLGLEVPIRPNWSLEPRVAYGLTYSGDQGSVGHILQGSIASRFVIRGLGRGQLLIGNMVGYSATLKTPGDINLNPGVKNWSLRNGLAYEMPLGMQIGGRSTSMRASYAFTKYLGDELFNNSFHEFTLSFGLRGREDTPKALRDTMRLNFNTIQARGFSTYTAGIGFRF